MTSSENERSLVISETEIQSSIPDALKYFKAVDVMTEGIKPIDGKYFDILVYHAYQNQPSVKILRIENKYLDRNIGKQDEIELSTEERRLQLNAECDSEGNYVSYPTKLRPESSDYLVKVVGIFTELAGIDESRIYINHKQILVSRNGEWIPFKNLQKNERFENSTD